MFRIKQAAGTWYCYLYRAYYAYERAICREIIETAGNISFDVRASFAFDTNAHYRLHGGSD